MNSARRFIPGLLLAWFAFLLPTVHAQPQPQPNENKDTYDFNPAVGPNHRWVEWAASIPGPNSNAVPQRQSYVALEVGMNYLENGRWVPTEELIEPHPKGAAATRGSTKVVFSHDIARRGAIQIKAPAGTTINNHPLGLYYYDRKSGDTVLLGAIKSTLGEIAPPNRVVYRDAFQNIRADLVYTYRKGSFEADVIIRDTLPEPAEFNLENVSTVLEMVTEFVDSPDPAVERRKWRSDNNADGAPAFADPDLWNDDLTFGEIPFCLGTAFLEQDRGDRTKGLPVLKRWDTQHGGRKLLREQVSYTDVHHSLAQLTSRMQARPGPVRSGRELPSLPPASEPNPSPMNHGAAPGNHGFTIDYTTLTGITTGYTFANNTTYFITNTFQVNGGTCTFSSGAVIKYANNAEFLVSSGATVAGSGATFTSMHDNSVGQIIDGSDWNPTTKTFRAFWIYYTTYNISFTGHTIKYAGTAVRASSNLGSSNQHTIANLSILNTSQALYAEKPGGGSVLVLADEIGYCDVAVLTAGDANMISIADKNQCPIVSITGSTTGYEDMPLVVTYTVSDDHTPVASLQSSAGGDGSYPWLWYQDPVVHAGSGSTRTSTFTPWPNSSGVGKWWITVSEPGGLTKTVKFDATIAPINDPPSLTGAIELKVRAGAESLLQFAIADVETGAANTTVSIHSYETDKLESVEVLPTGQAALLMLRVYPKDGFQNATITMALQDNQGGYQTRILNLTITPNPDDPDNGASPDPDVAGNNPSEPCGPLFGLEEATEQLRVDLPNTPCCNTADLGCSIPLLDPVTDSITVIGSPGCEYLFNAEIEAAMRVSDGNSNGPYDNVNFQEIGFSSGGTTTPHVSNPVDSMAACGAMQTMTNSGLVLLRFVECSPKTIGLIYRPGGNQNYNPGFKDAFARVKRVWGLMARRWDGESKDNDFTFVNSIDISRGLGFDSFGFGSPKLHLKVGTITPDICTSKELIAGPIANGSELLCSAYSKAVRQLLTPSSLVDICSNSVNSYSMRFLALSLTSGPPSKLTNGLYNTNGLRRWKEIEVRRPNPLNTNCYQIVDCRFDQVGSITDLVTNQYDYLPAVGGTSVWTLTRGPMRRVERLDQFASATGRTELRSVLETNSFLQLLSSISKERSKYETLPFGSVLTERTLAPDGNARTGRYFYYTNVSDNGYARLRLSTNSSGSWQIFHYDSAGRLSELFTSFTNEPPTTNGSLCRKIQYDYSTNVISGSGDIGAYRPQLPRREIEFLKGQEVARRYFVYLRGERREITCLLPNAAWNASGNLVSITKRRTRGPFAGQLDVVIHPDGTCNRYEYHTTASALTNIVWQGVPDATGTNVVQGTKLVTVKGLAGQTISRHLYDVATMVLLERDVYTDFDPDTHQPRTVTHLDGTVESSDGGCCGAGNAESLLDREGVITQLAYDELGRLTNSVRLGVSTFQRVDAKGRIVEVYKKATDEPSYSLITQRAYDDAGRLVSEVDAAGVITTFAYTVDSLGQNVTTTTFAFGTASESYRSETYARDGKLISVSGSAATPTRYEYGVDSIDGINARFRKEIRIDSIGGQLEWSKTYTDMAGRDFKTVYAASSQPYPATLSTYDALGRLSSQRDIDGVVTLYQYGALGELEYTAIDLNGNGSIDLGTDRVTRTVSDVVAVGAYGTNLRRHRVFEYRTNGTSTASLKSIAESTPDGLRSWRAVDGILESISSGISDLFGFRSTTNVSATGRSLISVYHFGRLATQEARDSGGTVIGRTTYEYDTHGRQFRVTDLRSGSTTYTYDALDRVVSITGPPSGAADVPQVSQTTYDVMGRPITLTQPDGTVVANEYYLNGLLKRTSGSRTYPVEYSYDAQGRMKTMKTWQTYAGGTGTPTITTWNYDSARGWLTSKLYANTNGPSYTYTPGGRLKTRTWARNHGGGSPIVTTYKYGFDDIPTTNQHPDIVEIAYNDGITPGSTNVYDRLGRPTSLSFGTNILTRLYTAAGLLDTESYTTGTMNGLKTVYTYDGTLRRSTVTPQNGAAVLGSARIYGYDTASRLGSVSDGTYSGAYAYLANSPLWGTLTFKQGSSTVRATTSRDFDLLNRLRVVSTTPGAGGSGWGPQYAYNSANQRTRRTDIDGSYWVYEYDSLGQVISGKRFWADGSPVAGQQYEYAYDDIGNRTSSKEGGDNSGQALRSSAYSRNSLNQYTARTNAPFVDILGLANASAAVSVNGVAASRSGEYFRRELAITNAAGPVGTITTIAAFSGASSSNLVGTLLSPPANQVLTYDADGNLLSDGLWDYTWDGENRLLSVQSVTTLAAAQRRRVSWQYDAAGRRIQQTTAGWNGSNSTWTNANDLKLLYDGWACIAELNATNNALIASYAWGLDLSGTPTGAGGVGGLLWIRPNGGAAHFAVYDGNGNVIGLVDGSTGLESARYEYDTFGNTIRLTGTGTIARDNKFRFSTKRTEPESSLILYEYRPYSSTLGRWPNRDPIGEEGGANLYGFVQNQPIGRFDKLGLSTMWLDPIITPIPEPIAYSQNPNGPKIYGWTRWKFFKPTAKSYRPLPPTDCACGYKVFVGGSVQVEMSYVSWAPAIKQHEMNHINHDFRSAFDAFRENSEAKGAICYTSKAKADCVASVISNQMARAYMLQALAAGADYDFFDYGMPRGTEQQNYANALGELERALANCK